MRFLYICTSVLCLLLLISLVPISQSFAADATKYVDLDGDGFDDNATDDDLDGIPDKFASRRSQNATPRTLVDMNKMFQADVTLSAALSQSNHILYTGRRAAVLSLATCRGGLGRFDRFGGEASGQNSSGGGACAGGVCR